jgi:selenocysteine lyase/cysteine desulfurase
MTIADAQKPTQTHTFGEAMKPFFYNRKGFININHGSFGTTPRNILQALHNYQIQMEESCDEWYRETALHLYKNTLETISSFINAPAQDIALVDNASVGVNAVLRSLPVLNARDKETSILFTSIAYPMVRQLLYYLRDNNPNIKLIEVPLNTATLQTHESIINAFRESLEQNRDKNIVLAVFDHIVSMPHLILPVKQLCDLCASFNVLTMVDGAHAIGQVPIDMNDLGADFYTCNMHKWLFVPKASAILYVRHELRSQVRPTTISWGYQNKNFDEEFFWCGTRDLSAFFCAQDAIQWRREIGGEEKINKYCNELAYWAGDHLASVWGTRVLFGENRHVVNAAMTNVELPTQNKQMIELVVQVLMDDYHSFMATFELDGKWYTRVSTHIYNTKEEIEQVGKNVLEIIQGLENNTITVRQKIKGMF